MGALANSASMVSASMDFSFRGRGNVAYTARTYDTRPRARCHPGAPPASAPALAPDSFPLRDPSGAAAGLRLPPRDPGRKTGARRGAGACVGRGAEGVLRVLRRALAAAGPERDLARGVLSR